MLFEHEPEYKTYSIVEETVDESLVEHDDEVDTGKQGNKADIALLSILTVWTVSWIVLSPNRRLHYITERRLLFAIIILLQWLPLVLMTFYVPSQPIIGILNIIVTIVVTTIKVSRVLLFIPLLSCWRSPCVLGRAMARSWKEVGVIIFIMTLFVAISGYLVFIFELHSDESHFRNVPAGMWWAVITVTTVGYGEYRPVSKLGKLVGIMLAISGFILMALPVPVLYRNFQEECKKEKAAKKTSHQPGRVIIHHTSTVV